MLMFTSVTGTEFKFTDVLEGASKVGCLAG